ncbi:MULTISPECIES: 30S ribosomal protein S4 [Micromonospora]|uniref:Small ribosomal subunit protein uS4 n=1 Tax=Micromonospora aurantiaca (nom. illeg.) TaxID=47850 RepID=A0A6N9XU94_9ACTN|nr:MULTISPECIES: 30S ribosomal protein S4 [Micromonospora]AXH94008.1 30S ribosomal protein S4 [Micromonospora aurantiaca]KAB1114698.1 30S ribosomal protein S4 [Micromonospora aurantiaca]MBC9001047.1 30S ribosomal protein S4 [Micromonospora aurantiaca]MDG4753220.1 30S ribosomal protein S4 [Micromonospora sp. WMMD718]MDW3849126.1 30S ribosomal protein S4 [Micromonospora sp. BRA006-A]
MNHPRPKARLSRALGIPLTRKCVRYFERRPYPPGVHGRSRRTTSDYQVRLLEKQRLRHQYNVSEAQLRRLFDEAARGAGKTGETLVALLERRLDAVVLRAGLARSIYQARQLVAHGHITVDGRKVDRPSYRLRPGQVVGVRERSRALPPFQLAAAGAHADAQPRPYLSAQPAELRATLVREPARHEVPVVCDEQLVVEFYSR